MADETLETVKISAQAKGPGLMGLVKAAAFITVIVIVEVVAASMLIPSARDTEILAQELASAAETHAADKASDEKNAKVADETPEEEVKTTEVLLWADSVTRFNPESMKTLTVDIEIYVSVLAEEELEFTERFERNMGRVGEQVVMTMHAASAADFTPAGLGLIKRKILEKTNRALGKPLIREVLFPQVNFVER